MAWTYGRTFSLLGSMLLLAGAPLSGSTVPDHPWCGTSHAGMAAQVAIHRDQQRRLRESGKAVRGTVQAERVGDVAVLVDDGSMVVQPNPLDLSNVGIQYVPQKKGGLVASPSDAAFEGEIGERIVLGDDDSREIAFPKKFRFRFFGRVQSRLFVHSDGNLTFAVPDAASTDRDLNRLISGPPRIAPLFADLDPGAAVDEGGVYVLTSAAKIVVTWRDVPQFGLKNRNTFQVVLYPDGRITFAFGTLQAREAVVGLAPGNSGAVQLLDFTTSLPSGVLKTGVAERFVTSRTFDHLAVARAFFREFADVYDHLVVFLDFQQSLGGGAFAFESAVKNEIRGIGVPIFDNTAQVGSRGRLRSFVQMGALARYPADPETEFLGTNSTLDVLGQETGHRWLSYLQFIDDNGEASDALLGRDLAHWSYCHDSEASDMEGNDWQDDGNFFSSVGATDRFSPLDQYAMGLIGAADVPPFFYIDNCFNPAAAPEVGVRIQGSRIDVAIDRIIAAEGPRVPDFRKAPHAFDMAFILVAEAGQFPSGESIAKVDRIRAAWVPYFAAATDGRGSLRTAIQLKPRR